MIRASAVAGMVAAAVWIVALVIEYQYGLRTPGGGSAAYQADQTAFLIASVGYLALLIGLFRSKAAGDGLFGRIAVGIWTIALTAVALSQALSFVAVSAVFLLPFGGVGQILGSLFTSIAVWRTRRWTGWRRWAPAIWTATFFVTIGAAITAIPILSIPAASPNPTAPSPVVEGLWQVTWFLLGLALYIEAGRSPKHYVAAEETQARLR